MKFFPLTCALTCTICLIGVFLEAKPAQILLLRHAERLNDKTEELSLRGRERAAALAPYLTGTEEYMRYGPFAAIFAPSPGGKDTSHRTKDTMEPLAHMLNNLSFGFVLLDLQDLFVHL